MSNEQPSDGSLLAAAARGDDAAFGILVRRHIRAATLLAFQWLGDMDDAEDVVQRAFLVVHQQARDLDPARPFPPWLRHRPSPEGADGGPPVAATDYAIEIVNSMPHEMTITVVAGAGERIRVHAQLAGTDPIVEQEITLIRGKAVKVAL